MTNEDAIEYIKLIFVRDRANELHFISHDEKIALDLAIKALEEQERPTGDRKCVTCKYCDGKIINKPCRTCSHAWADLYEEAENEQVR